MQRALSFDNSPALSVPLRFFLTAPLFALLAALLLLWVGPQALASRWTPHTLALTHLFTLGVLASAMAGALMQILPVATGVNVLAPRLTSWLVHALLTSGTLVLAAAFVLMRPLLFKLALCTLAPALAWLLVACLGGCWRHRRNAAKGAKEILQASRLALVALLLTLSLGGLLAAGFGWPQFDLPLALLTDAHAAWGLFGWVGLLVAGMAYQVIPIFQVTELYPRTLTQWMAPLVFTLLVLATGSMLADTHTAHAISRAMTALLLAAYAIFAGVTFYLLWTRKRPKPDTTTLFWRTAMLSLASCAPLGAAQLVTGTDYSVTLGILFIVGFGWSAVNGMLYKILPFLLWYHAQKNLTIALRIVPKVKDIIPDPVARRQFRVHLCAVLLLTAASLWPAPFTHAAAIALAASAAWLGWNMAGAIRLYLKVKKQIEIGRMQGQHNAAQAVYS